MRYLILVILLIATPASATTWYVNDSTGHDTNNDCTEAQSPSLPKKTIGAAFTCVGTSAGAGANDVVEVASGTYTELLQGSWPSGTNGNVFTLRSAAQYGAIVAPGSGGNNGGILQPNGDYITIDGFIVDGTGVGSSGVWFEDGTTGITLQNSEVRDFKGCIGTMTPPCALNEMLNGVVTYGVSGSSNGRILNNLIHNVGYDTITTSPHRQHCMYWKGDGVLIEGNSVYDCNGTGILIYNNDVGQNDPDNAVIRNNRVYDFARNTDCCSAGIHLDAGINNVAYNNLVYQTAANGRAHGIDLRVSNQSAYNNTIYNIDNSGIRLNDAVSNISIRNNIIIDTGTDLSGLPSSGANCSHNLTEDAQDADCTSAVSGGAPTFVNAGTFDFRLDTGSNGIDDGVSLAGTVDEDFIGTSRPQGSAFDVGAYEFSVGDDRLRLR